MVADLLDNMTDRETQIFKNGFTAGYKAGCDPNWFEGLMEKDPGFIMDLNSALVQQIVPIDSEHMICIRCKAVKHVNDFATPDECQECFRDVPHTVKQSVNCVTTDSEPRLFKIETSE